MRTHKFNFAIIAILISGMAIQSCSENRRVIEPFVPTGDRVVLIEEFTGKGCTNCPKGSRELDNLLLQFPNNLIAVSIHAGFFANPQFFPLGIYDLRTDEGEFLFDYLGPNLGYPAGVVNRTLVNGDMQLGLNQWASAITAQIQQTPDVELSVSSSFDPVSRLLQVGVTTIGKRSLSGEVRLSVMLTESGIVDAQDDQEAGGIVQDYVHNHVMRIMLTPAAGAKISDGLAIGATNTFTQSLILPDDWNADKMEAIAFVSLINGNNFPVLQAAQVHLHE